MRRLPLSIAAACGMWAVTLIAHDADAPPTLRPPTLLSETGLFVSGSTAIAPENWAYTPQYPLWSDGAIKSRWVYLPRGARIDAHDVDEWEFPAGTRFWKEFAFNGRKVETRMLWKSAPDNWTFATYVWNQAQTDAILAPAEGVPGIVEIAPGKRHSIPSVADCRACHESNRIQVLGFTALQLSTDRDPGAVHAEPMRPEWVTLKTLIDRGVLHGAPDDLLSRPPRIQADTAATRSVLGYLSTNCGACHVTNGPLASLGLNFRQKTRGPIWTRADIARLLQRPTTWQRPGAGEDPTMALVPGAPDLSGLLHRMRSRRPSSQMPPLGTVVQDSEAVTLVTTWIRNELAPNSLGTNGGD
jgi:hypothetical protein